MYPRGATSSILNKEQIMGGIHDRNPIGPQNNEVLRNKNIVRKTSGTALFISVVKHIPEEQ